MNITIGRYTPGEVPEGVISQYGHELTTADAPGDPATRWESWIEPDDKAWILFVGTDGTAVFWPEREPSGGVIGEPTVSPPR